MKTAALACVLLGLVHAQNPLARLDPFVGTFQGDEVTLEMTGARGQYSGSLTVQGNTLAVTAKAEGGNATGSFEVNGRTYSFTLTPVGSGLKLASGGAEYALARKGAPRASPADPERDQPRSSSIVGSWRNATGSARFNADGTGVMDGQPGSYEISGNQITLIGAQGQITLPFEVRRDTLTLTVNGAAVVLNRVREETGPGSIHTELAGKWCWISIVNAQQGARQSSQCITMEPNGTYTYVYTLEKRNHPKNKDPMIVLNGQPFVTYYNKPPW